MTTAAPPRPAAPRTDLGPGPPAPPALRADRHDRGGGGPAGPPLAFLVLQSVQTGWGELRPVLFRRFTLTLLWNTVRLTVVVTALSAP